MIRSLVPRDVGKPKLQEAVPPADHLPQAQFRLVMGKLPDLWHQCAQVVFNAGSSLAGWGNNAGGGDCAAGFGVILAPAEAARSFGAVPAYTRSGGDGDAVGQPEIWARKGLRPTAWNSPGWVNRN